MQPYQILSNTRLFIETDSKVPCSGTLSHMQLHIYHRLAVDDESGEGEDSRSDDGGCEWGVQFGLLRRNRSTDEILLVKGSNSIWIRGSTTSTSCEIRSINFTYPDPRPMAVTGDHFAVLIRICGLCIVQPFPLSFNVTRTDNTKQLHVEFDTLSDVKLNSSTVEKSPGWNSSFDARVQLTGIVTWLAIKHSEVTNFVVWDPYR